jgi:hypothetical protein
MTHFKSNIQPDIIWETQPNPVNHNKGSIYNDILASIGLDSPNISLETRREDVMEQNQVANTPTRSSAISLMALGKHVLTPRQEKIWSMDGNSK